MSTSSAPSCTLDLDNELCIFQEEEKIRRENLQRIMEENQKKIEEQNKKMVFFYFIKCTFNSCITYICVGGREIKDHRGTNED